MRVTDETVGCVDVVAEDVAAAVLASVTVSFSFVANGSPCFLLLLQLCSGTLLACCHCASGTKAAAVEPDVLPSRKRLRINIHKVVFQEGVFKDTGIFFSFGLCYVI